MKYLLKWMLVLSLGPLLVIEAIAATQSPSTVSIYIYKKLNQAQQKMDAGAPEEALLILDNIIRQQRSSAYEKALAQQASGLAYYQQKKIPQAIRQFNVAINSNALPLPTAQKIRYNLAQLLLSEQRYDESIKTINHWLALADKPSAEIYLLLASVHSHAQQYPAAIKPAELAIKLLNRPTESHYRFLLGLYFETENHPPATSLLEQLTLKFPEKKEYWLQLASLYSQANRDQDSLAITKIAYQKGLLKNNDEIVRLTQLLLHLQYPHKAARILKKELASGTVKNSRQNQELLATAWFNAREYKKALIPLQLAAEKSGDGELYFRLAQAQFEIGLHEEVIRNIEAAKSKGSLKKPGAAYLLEGIAHHQLEHVPAANQAFETAATYEATQDQARRWINFLQQQ